MGTFAAGHMLDPYTGRPIAAQVVKVLAWPTDLPVTPDGGPIATGARGGYGQFTVPDLDAVTLVASDGTAVGPLASVEAQVAAGNAGPFLESAEDRLSELESRSGTYVPPGEVSGDFLSWGADGAVWAPPPAGGGDGGGVSDHRHLSGRNAADQHVIGSVTGLQDALDDKADADHSHDGRYYTQDEADDRYTRHIVLDEGEPVPPGTPDGTLILRRTPGTGTPGGKG